MRPMPLLRRQDCKVWLADDSHDDRLFMKLAMEAHHIFRTIHESTNGHDVIQYLAGSGQYADRIKHPMPDLVLLDLHMPLHDGLEVLRWAHESVSAAEVDIVVFTGSDDPEQIQQALRLGALRCCGKPDCF